MGSSQLIGGVFSREEPPWPPSVRKREGPPAQVLWTNEWIRTRCRRAGEELDRSADSSDLGPSGPMGRGGSRKSFSFEGNIARAGGERLWTPPEQAVEGLAVLVTSGSSWARSPWSSSSCSGWCWFGSSGNHLPPKDVEIAGPHHSRRVRPRQGDPTRFPARRSTRTRLPSNPSELPRQDAT